MIEQIILFYMLNAVEEPIYMEEPENPPPKFYLMEKTGSGQADMLFNSTLALQSIAPTMYEAADMNEKAKTAMLNAVTLPQVTRIRLNSDYNYTDTQAKRNRYQAVYDLTHY